MFINIWLNRLTKRVKWRELYRKLTAVKHFLFFEKTSGFKNIHTINYYVNELFTLRALKLLKSSALFTQRVKGNEFTQKMTRVRCL